MEEEKEQIIKDYQEAKRRLFRDLSRAPMPEEIASEMGVDVDEIESLEKRKRKIIKGKQESETITKKVLEFIKYALMALVMLGVIYFGFIAHLVAMDVGGEEAFSIRSFMKFVGVCFGLFGVYVLYLFLKSTDKAKKQKFLEIFGLCSIFVIGIIVIMVGINDAILSVGRFIHFIISIF